jgi:hypothetical protein
MAAANKFQIQVVAIDKATQVFRKVNTSMSDVMRPATRLQRQLGALSKEAHLDKLVKGFDFVSRSAANVADNLGLAVTPLEALAGLGAAGGIVATLTAAVGAGALLSKTWADSGAEIGKTSQLIGISAKDLQFYRRAAEQAQVPADEFTQGLSNMAQALHQMQYGYRSDLAGMLKGWGVALKTDKDGAIQLTDALGDIADAISKYKDPQTRLNLARQFGIEGLLPFLVRGKQGIQDLVEESKKLGPAFDTNGVKQATQFEQSLARSKIAVEAITNKWGGVVGPYGARGLDAITDTLTGERGKTSKSNWLLRNGYSLGPLAIPAYQAGLLWSMLGGERVGANPMSGPLPIRGDTGGRPLIGTRVDPRDQRDRDDDRLTILRNELATETDPGARAALQREIARAQAQLTGEGGAVPPAPQRVKVDVSFSNAPPGTTARISDEAGGLGGHLRISHVQPGTP